MPLFPTSSAPAGAARQAAREASPWVRRLARLGYAAKGIVYLVIGALALQAARTPSERPEDSGGALRVILHQPLGRVALAVVAVGLVGYALWRLVQALLDPEREGSGAKGVLRRAGYLLSGLLHGGLALEAGRLLLGSAGSGRDGDQQADHWTALVLAQPLGRWVVGVVGAGVIAFGVYELVRGATADLRRRLDLSGLGERGRSNVLRLGRLGLAARGVVFAIIGWFLLLAAWRYDAQEATGLAGALAALRTQSYGPWLLGGVAVGLVAYGLWQLANARYRRIHPL